MYDVSFVMFGRSIVSAQTLKVSLLRVGEGVPSRKGCEVSSPMSRTSEYATAPSPSYFFALDVSVFVPPCAGKGVERWV